VLTNAKQPELAHEFVSFLRSAEGQALFREHGYNAPRGADL
jgi:molybdate/tungstate transport system substrate-binding protein